MVAERLERVERRQQAERAHALGERTGVDEFRAMLERAEGTVIPQLKEYR